jgi:hypothetical protein
MWGGASSIISNRDQMRERPSWLSTSISVMQIGAGKLGTPA